MHFDLELFLLVGTLLTGAVWLLDKLVLRSARAEASTEPSTVELTKDESNEPWYVEYSRSFFPVLLAVLLLRSFIAEPFRIPSGSMIPTLHIGDFILVNKFAYGLRAPVTHTKLLALGEPERGDVAVFRYPRDTRLDYIKRIVGLPGDRVAFKGKRVFINGKAPEYKEIGVYETHGSDPNGVSVELTENFFGVEHSILINPNRGNVEGEVVVPDGHYFVVGDNRDNSNDSRYWGFVPEENLVGRAMVIWMNWNIDKGRVDFGRVGTVIK